MNSRNNDSTLCNQSGVPHHVTMTDRRSFLKYSGAGFGALAFNGMMQQQANAEFEVLQGDGTTLPQVPHHFHKAKSVIFLFMEGGPSHLDTFDPKPLINKLDGKQLPSSFKAPITAMGEKNAPIMASPRKWKRYGESGIPVSDWFPHVGQCIDDIAVLRSCWGTGINHAGGVCLMNTAVTTAGRPSLGAWVSYGLGTENQNLPSFVVLTDSKRTPVNGPRNWGTGFMPAKYQGVRIQSSGEPIQNLQNPKGITVAQQNSKLDFLKQMNQSFAQKYPQQTELEARIKSYELAFRMQAEAPEAVDLSQETKTTQNLYGMEDKETEVFGRNCLLARRLVERGVRFIQLYHGAGSKWDSHSAIEKNHSRLCNNVDRPIAGLLTDLKQRGLLDETLVVWGGEFGRTPMSEKGNGRDHNPTGFTMWMAGGGVKGGQVIGSTDELGLHAVENRLHVHDIHSTILHLLGLNSLKLTYNHIGRPERPTLNEGHFPKQLTGEA